MIAVAKYPPKKRGRPLHGDAPKQPLTIRVPESLRDALMDMAISTRRSVPTEAQIAIEEYLSKHGFWPPKKEKPGR